MRGTQCDRGHSGRRRRPAEPPCPHRAGAGRRLDPRRPSAGRHGEADARSGLDRSPGDAPAKEARGPRDCADRFWGGAGLRVARDFRNHSFQSNVVRPPTTEDIMAEKDLNELFLDTLKDIYYAEKQILKALPKMAKAANSDKLRAAFEKHHGETEDQVERLEQIFELMDKPARAKTCEAIQGILDEGKMIM